jgi:hypothetical protein
MVLESSDTPIKRGRWRPKKTQTTLHHQHDIQPQIPTTLSGKKTSPVKKDITREEELAAFERHSNKSGVLTLLVLLLGLGLIAYGMYLKLRQSSPDVIIKNPVQNLTNILDTKDTTNTQAPSEKKWVNQPQVNSPIIALPWDGIIADYFARIEKKQISTLALLQDKSFGSIPTLRTYFNTSRLTTFSKNIATLAAKNIQEVTNDPVLKRNPTSKAYDFTMSYSLTSWPTEYNESWRAYTVTKWSGSVINWFVYQGTGTSQSPFFQFVKYGIK